MEPPSDRLDGWKAIAAHLGRDERTAQRWRHRGLPVHTVPGGRKGTVFAYVHELDAWMAHEPAIHDEPRDSSRHDEPHEPPPHDGAPLDQHLETPPAHHDERLSRWPGATLSLTLTGLLGLTAGVGLALVTGWRPVAPIRGATRSSTAASQIVRAEVTPGGLVAWRADGRPAFSVASSHLLPAYVPLGATEAVEARKVPLVMDLDDDGISEVVVILGFHDNSPRVSEEVRVYNADGGVRWRHQIAQRLRFGNRDFDGPWRVTDQLVTRDAEDGARLWLTVIHDVWWPSFVLSLDATGTAGLHLVHSGHLYALAQVETAQGNRLVAAGVNNEYKSAVMVALDPGGPPVTSPQGSAAFTCEGCADGTPARYLLLPQAELSLLEGRPYNLGTMVGAIGSLSRVSTDEVPDPRLVSHYTLSTDLDPTSVEMSDLYWAQHRRLEAEGRISHSTDDCPERLGRTVRSWTGGGWQDIWVPSGMPPP